MGGGRGDTHFGGALNLANYQVGCNLVRTLEAPDEGRTNEEEKKQEEGIGHVRIMLRIMTIIQQQHYC